jgi:hypothetical protein
LESMIELYTLISSILDRICEWKQNHRNIQDMTFGYFPSNICWKSKHGEQNGKGAIDKIDEWATWWWANVKINK